MRAVHERRLQPVRNLVAIITACALAASLVLALRALVEPDPGGDRTAPVQRWGTAAGRSHVVDSRSTRAELAPLPGGTGGRKPTKSGKVPAKGVVGPVAAPKWPKGALGPERRYPNPELPQTASPAGPIDPTCALHDYGKILKDVGKYILGHFGGSATACFIVCLSGTFQNGQIWVGYGGEGMSFRNFKPNMFAGLVGTVDIRDTGRAGPLLYAGMRVCGIWSLWHGMPGSADGSRPGWVGVAGGQGFGWFAGGMHSGKAWYVRDPLKLRLAFQQPLILCRSAAQFEG